jgi:hypothetical protein
MEGEKFEIPKYSEFHLPNEMKTEIKNTILEKLDKSFLNFVNKIDQVESLLDKEHILNNKTILEKCSYNELNKITESKDLNIIINEIYDKFSKIMRDKKNTDTKLIYNKLEKENITIKEEYKNLNSEIKLINYNYNDYSYYFGESIRQDAINEKEKEDAFLKNGFGIHKNIDRSIQYGRFEKDIFKEGILVKMEDKDKISFFDGTFQSKENEEETVFNGFYIPPSTGDENSYRLIFFMGEINFKTNTFNGIFCFRGTKIFEVFVGKMIDNFKEGSDTMLISFTYQKLDNYENVTVFRTDMQKGKPKGISLFYHNSKLLEINNDEKDDLKKIISKFLKIKTPEDNPSIYIGNVIFEANKYIPFSENSVLVFSSGQFYLGGIKENLKEGEGYCFTIDESTRDLITVKGVYNNDVLIEGEIFKNDSLLFQGKFKNNLMSLGKYYYDDNEFYVGDFSIDGKRNGRGLYHYADNSEYEGEWKDNKKNGEGTFKNSKGNVFKGVWKDDKLEMISN